MFFSLPTTFSTSSKKRTAVGNLLQDFIAMKLKKINGNLILKSINAELSVEKE